MGTWDEKWYQRGDDGQYHVVARKTETKVISDKEFVKQWRGWITPMPDVILKAGKQQTDFLHQAIGPVTHLTANITLPPDPDVIIQQNITRISQIPPNQGIPTHQPSPENHS